MNKECGIVHQRVLLAETSFHLDIRWGSLFRCTSQRFLSGGRSALRDMLLVDMSLGTGAD